MFWILRQIIHTYLSSLTVMLTDRSVGRRRKLTIDETRDLIKFYFEPSDGQDYWTCRNESCRKKYKQATGSGYTNLKKHLSSCVGDYLTPWQNATNSSRGSLVKFLKQDEQDVFDLIIWIVHENLPLALIEHACTRKVLKCKPPTRKTLRKYILQITNLVEKKVAEELPESFALMIDGWTDSTVHYMAIIATYIDKNGTYQETMLACRPLNDQEFLDAPEIMEFLDDVVRSYNKKLDCVVALMGDNCATNMKVARELNIPLLGCAAHKMNLAVNKFIDDNPDYSNLIDKITSIMNELRNLKTSGRLRKFTDLCPVRPNKTRWSGKYKMCKRYLELEQFIEAMPLDDSLYLSMREKRVLEKLTKHLKNFHDITKKLQERGILLPEVRNVFDAAIDDYPELEEKLGSRCKLVTNPEFESGIIKILEGEECNLTCLECTATKTLLNVPEKNVSSSPSDEEDDPTDYYQLCALKRRKLNKAKETKSAYIDLRFLTCTSVAVERLFSTAGSILTDDRRHMRTNTFEALVYLRMNQNFWDVQTVASVMKGSITSKQTNKS